MNHYNVVLGAGITGLTAAYELSKKSDVLVIEKNRKIGGLLRSISRDHYFIEEYYHHVFPRDSLLFDFLEEFGLEDEIVWDYPPTAFEYMGNLYQLSSPQDMLFFRPLSLRDRVTLARLTLKMKGMEPGDFDNTGVKQWLIDNGNERIYERFFAPMLKSKFGKNLDNVSASWFLERMKLRANRGLRGEKLGYMKGGFRKLIDALRKGIEGNGGMIKAHVDNFELKQDGKIIRSIGFNGETVSVKNIVSTIPPKSLIKAVKFPADYENRLLSVGTQGSVCIVLGLRKSLSKFYWTNIMSGDVDFGAVIEHNNFSGKLGYPETIVYLASYPDSDSKIWGMERDEIFGSYFRDLKKIFPHIEYSDVNWWEVVMDRDAGILYDIGTKDRLPGHDTPVKNLFMGGVFNSYPERSINTSMERGVQLARCVEDA